MSRSSKYQKGRADAAKGKYSPPHGLIDDITTWGSKGMERNRRENEEYREGHNDKKREMQKKK